MHIANVELGRELYHLTLWGTGRWHRFAPGPDLENNDVPKYDLGYLLRKLPKENPEGLMLQLRFYDEDYCYAGYYDDRGNSDLKTESGPCRDVDAAAKLCIELIKQGILDPKKEVE